MRINPVLIILGAMLLIALLNPLGVLSLSGVRAGEMFMCIAALIWGQRMKARGE